MLLLFWVPLWLLSVSTVVSIFSWYCLHSSATPHFYRGIQWQRWFRDFARRRDPTFKIRVRDLKKNFPEDETERKNDKSETPRPIKNTSKISRSGQNFPRLAFFEVAFYTSFYGPLLALSPCDVFPGLLGQCISVTYPGRTAGWNLLGPRDPKRIGRAQ